MNSNNTCYFNGKLIPYHALSLHVSDLLLQRGYGIFDFFRLRNGEIPWLEDYTERLYNSIRLAEIETPLDRQAFINIVHELHAKNQDNNSAFKVIVTGGYSDTLSSVTGESNLIILNLPWTRPAAASYEKGVQLISLEYVRPHPEIKTLNYFNTMALRKKMRQYDAVDILYYTDTIHEASRACLFFGKDGILFTPASNILQGVTRKQVLALFGDIRIEDIPADRLHEFDEMFMASTSRDITPVVGVEGKPVGNGIPGKRTREIQEVFRNRGWM